MTYEKTTLAFIVRGNITPGNVGWTWEGIVCRLDEETYPCRCPLPHLFPTYFSLNDIALPVCTLSLDTALDYLQYSLFSFRKFYLRNYSISPLFSRHVVRWFKCTESKTTLVCTHSFNNVSVV